MQYITHNSKTALLNYLKFGMSLDKCKTTNIEKLFIFDLASLKVSKLCFLERLSLKKPGHICVRAKSS